MVMTDQQRHALHTKLEEVLGPVHSANLKASLPPSNWQDIATKQDLESLRVATRHDLERLRADVREDLDVMREALRNEFRAELQETRAELLLAMAGQTRTVVLANVGTLLALAALAFAALRLN